LQIATASTITTGVEIAWFLCHFLARKRLL